VSEALQVICVDSGMSCSDCASENLSVKARWSFNKHFQLHYKEGFSACNVKGVGEVVHPEFSGCRPSLTDTEVCQPKPNQTEAALRQALDDICTVGGSHFGVVDCSRILSGGSCVFPTGLSGLIGQCEWAFNKYYQNMKYDVANPCHMGGTAELVTPVCGKLNHGNPQTGRGYAYPNRSYCATKQCGCHDTTCLNCVTFKPSPDMCEFLCPWVTEETYQPNFAELVEEV